MTVVFTGLLRHPEMFTVQLEILRQLPFVEDIIFSTWSDQVAAHRDQLDTLVCRYGLRVIHTDQPAIQTPAAFSNQMLSLARGLRERSSADHVLRTRTDLVLDADALAHVCAKDIEIPAGRVRDLNLFHQKITFSEAEITTPFMFDDIFFYGHRADLWKFVHFDLKFDILYMLHSPFHEKVFGTFFDRIFPGLGGYYCSDWIFSGGGGPLEWMKFDNNSYRPEFIAQAMTQPAFADICALYYVLARDLVSLDWGTEADFFHIDGARSASIGRRWSGKSFDECRTLSDVFCNPAHFTWEGFLSTGSDRFFARAVDRDFEDCPIGRCLGAALDRLDRLEDLRLAALDADFTTFYERNCMISAALIDQRVPAFLRIAQALQEKGNLRSAAQIMAGIARHNKLRA